MAATVAVVPNLDSISFYAISIFPLQIFYLFVNTDVIILKLMLSIWQPLGLYG